MKKLLLIAIPMAILSSCVLETTNQIDSGKEKSRKSISGMENELLELPVNSKEQQKELKEAKLVMIDTLLAYYRNYPSDTMAPVYLDKVHMLYSGMNEYRLASDYADLIIKDYPNYVNRKMIIESQIMSHDVFIQPRDSSKVKYYIELLLKEYPDMSKSDQIEYQNRLNHLDQPLFMGEEEKS